MYEYTTAAFAFAFRMFAFMNQLLQLILFIAKNEKEGKELNSLTAKFAAYTASGRALSNRLNCVARFQVGCA